MGFGGTGGGAGSIQASTDVALSGLSNNDVLTYNSTDTKWENKPISGGASPTLDNVPPGTTISIIWDMTNNVWKDGSGATISARPSARTDITMIAKGGATGPSFGIAGDIWLKDNAL